MKWSNAALEVPMVSTEPLPAAEKAKLECSPQP